MINYNNFLIKYPNNFIPSNIFSLLHADAIAETSSINFGVLLDKATELLILHYAEIIGAWGTTGEADAVTGNVKSFQLNHEGYKVDYQDSTKNPLASTRWGLEYQRLVAQVSTEAIAQTEMMGSTLVAHRRSISFYPNPLLVPYNQL